MDRHRTLEPFKLLLTIDLEEQRRLEGAGFFIEAYELALEGARGLLAMLERLEVPATWFTTAALARKDPPLLRDLTRGRGQGLSHEVALHGLHDRDDYQALPEASVGSRLALAKRVVEAAAGTGVAGFRAPRFQAPDRRLLAGLGLAYDSSLHPSPMPGRYSGRGSLEPYRDPTSGLAVLPVSVVPGARLPLGWLWFRSLPLSYTRWGSVLVEARSDHLCLYFHPWDFMDLTPYKAWLPPGFTWGSTKALAKLERFLTWGLGRGWQPVTVKRFLRFKGLLTSLDEAPDTAGRSR